MTASASTDPAEAEASVPADDPIVTADDPTVAAEDPVVPTDPVVEPAADGNLGEVLAELRAQAAEASARQTEVLAVVTTQLSELLRLRARDVDLADRLYAENTRLRTGEFAAAVAPLLSGLLRLHDQMTALADGDASSVAGMLRIQLLQILDTAAGLSPFEPAPGERFDSTRHAGVGRALTHDPAADGTVAKNVKPGFERADGAVVRVAHVEVFRFKNN